MTSSGVYMPMFGSLLSALVAASFLGLGAGSYLAPRTLAEQYGLPVTDATGVAYVRALGARDAVLGLLVLAFLIARARGALGATVALSALVGASDFAVVASVRGMAPRTSLAIHGIGTVGLLVVWGVVRSGL